MTDKINGPDTFAIIDEPPAQESGTPRTPSIASQFRRFYFLAQDVLLNLQRICTAILHNAPLTPENIARSIETHINSVQGKGEKRRNFPVTIDIHVNGEPVTGTPLGQVPLKIGDLFSVTMRPQTDIMPVPPCQTRLFAITTEGISFEPDDPDEKKEVICALQLLEKLKEDLQSQISQHNPPALVCKEMIAQIQREGYDLADPHMGGIYSPETGKYSPLRTTYASLQKGDIVFFSLAIKRQPDSQGKDISRLPMPVTMNCISVYECPDQDLALLSVSSKKKVRHKNGTPAGVSKEMRAHMAAQEAAKKGFSR